MKYSAAEMSVWLLNQLLNCSSCVMQDLLILLDLIGTEKTQFSSWFPQTQKYYTQLQNIGKRTTSVSCVFAAIVCVAFFKAVAQKPRVQAA